MIDVSKLKLKLSQVLSSDKFILLSQATKPVFENNKPTERNQIVATVTTVESLFEKVNVRLESSAGIEISNEVLAERVKNLDFVYVSFDQDEVKVYRDYSSGQNRVTAKAKSMELADDTSINLN